MTLPDREDDPRWWRIAVVCVGAVALVTGIAIIDALPVGVFHDDAMYVILARSLASGHGYRYLNLPGAPVATQHPPGYPALLALVSMFVPAFPANIVAFKTLNALLAAASTVLVVLFARARALDPVPAIALGVASAVSIPLLLLSSMVLSEPLFFLLVVALLFAIERFVERQNGSWRPMAIGIGIAACALVRLNGIALLPATLVILAFKRRWRDAGIVTLATVVALLPWQVMVATHTGVLPAPLRGDYESASSWWLRGLHAHGPHVVIETIRKVVAEGAGMFGVLFSAMRGDLAHSITLVALATLSIAAVAAIRSRLPVTLLFLCGYLGIVVVWPYAPSRFLWAIWPLFLLLFTAGANWAWRGIAARRIRASDTRGTVARYAVLVAFAWVVVGYAEYEQRGLRDRWWSSASRSNAGRVAAAVAWVHDNTSLNDLVASEDEGAVYLYTGRHAVPIRSLAPDAYLRDIPASEAARDGLQPILAAYPVRVVIAGSRQTAETADVLIVSTPALLGSAIDFPGGVAYRVIARAGIAR
ncbi:MAG: hypothetical protein ABJF01_24190 [bacterium]